MRKRWNVLLSIICSPLAASSMAQSNLPLALPNTQLAIPSHSTHRHADRIPVDVKVTVAKANWVQNISICNISSKSIPLTDVEFSFNYSVNMPADIWGQPWLAWKLASQQAGTVVLVGGNPWASALAPDPNCTKPITIQFNATPTQPIPTGPFVFKAAGATPSSMGDLTISLPAIPSVGVSTPQVNVNGMGINLTQPVNWGTQWKVTSLVPGNYTISASGVDDGLRFYQASPITIPVTGQNTTQAAIQYVAVPTAQVNITLLNSPEPQEPIRFDGQTYHFDKMLSNNSAINLPLDTYTVTSTVAGYSAIVHPNPLVLPTNTALSISYEKAMNARFVAYMESWNEHSATDDAMQTNLANLPPYLNVVNLAFMKPDAVYVKGSMNYSQTGLQFDYPSQTVLKFAIAQLHRQNPGVKVLVAIGGATYTNWQNLNARAIADFVVDYGLDGVDIDYEPTTTGCALGTDNLVHCQIDTAFQGFVASLRSVLPLPYWITVTGYSVSAFGQDQWKTAQPQSQYTGMMLPLLRSVTAKDINMVNVMSYDAGTSFDPVQALTAYANYYPGPISMGVEVPPEAWGGHVYDLCQVLQLSQAVKASATQRNTVPGMMLWSIQKKPVGTASPTNPSAQMMATTICTNLGLSHCNQPLLRHSVVPLQLPNFHCAS